MDDGPIKLKLSKIFLILRTSVNNTRETGRKLVNLAQYIDFFVHDIVDFGVLSETSANFKRTLEMFDLNTALDEVAEIYHEKLTSK